MFSYVHMPLKTYYIESLMNCSRYSLEAYGLEKKLIFFRFMHKSNGKMKKSLLFFKGASPKNRGFDHF